jgi:hypothetical protein
MGNTKFFLDIAKGHIVRISAVQPIVVESFQEYSSEKLLVINKVGSGGVIDTHVDVQHNPITTCQFHRQKVRNVQQCH